ncbi:MAG TPA: hydrogen peroxide-dependent heme synthase [Terracidiphilus sp.]|nr:hydrogen peroxide-dependent heme synthase [Terracidiphilus sp.]
MVELPPVPLTLEGSGVLHQFFRFDWKRWWNTPDADRERIAEEATRLLGDLERAIGDAHVRSALYSQLGHKGDLILVHFRDNFGALNQVELDLARNPLYEFLIQVHSYVSIVELGLYESTRKTYEEAAAKGLEINSPEWQSEVQSTVERQSRAMAPRLYPSVPETKYFCFYPMDRKRGEQVNWYKVPFEDRQKMMHDHGLIGRRYGYQVKQIISGSIGLDDWEWGVDLFSDDPVAFKKLIYEMRFDEVSASYALFGQFFVGIRLPVEKLPAWLSGRLDM